MKLLSIRITDEPFKKKDIEVFSSKYTDYSEENEITEIRKRAHCFFHVHYNNKSNEARCNFDQSLESHPELPFPAFCERMNKSHRRCTILVKLSLIDIFFNPAA